ncbi:hypothetical protein HN695_04665 [Candidatus Woesearchaeota archaeon]|jgi:predicted Zn-dependent protease|nr:hypothetical protein [Candidatus Woesearchaeota archaeon]MBT5271869.1 hypothetical protein [Candidatus Woesearchaeota archaeon]MBT6041667.1 hypothetical protein [Candidatus Woesearchaeota archaeon]MBT6337357.1 hypothetical protein [Candidatus Woesearchaeota archaeon]MBT7927605.1 hypothetical protein [Candidatus Woesearchaeota archaeon]
MINKIKQLLQKRKIFGWKIEVISSKSTDLYFTKNLESESELIGDRFSIEIVVYKDYGEEIGESSFSIVEFNEKSINKMIDDALVICDYSRKPKFSLPTKSELKSKPKKLILVDKKLISPLKNLRKIANGIRTNLKKYNVKPNNLELQGSYLKLNVINSNGVDLKEEKTSFYVELTLTTAKKADGKVQEQEFVAMKEHASLSQFNAKEFVKENVNIVEDVLNSDLINSFKGNVVLTDDAAADFFAPHLGLSPLVMHASAKIKQMGLCVYSPKKKIANFKGDKISISTNPLLKLNPTSSLFDGDGVISKKVKLIEKGIFKNWFASKQYADYLGITATGALGAVEVNGGKKSMKNLKQTLPLVEIVSFSSFVPNSISGDFSAEIRLGYISEKNKAGKIIRKPFKGGMFIGNMFKIIENMWLSKEIIEVKGYRGPKIALFKNAIVAGMK